MSLHSPSSHEAPPAFNPCCPAERDLPTQHRRTGPLRSDKQQGIQAKANKKRPPRVGMALCETLAKRSFLPNFCVRLKF